MARKSGRDDWYFLASVDLGNGTQTREADEVGVVTRWKAPSLSAEVGGADVREIADRIGDLPTRREDCRAKEWVGKVVADVLGLDISQKAAAEHVKILLKGWIKSGHLKVVPGEDGQRRPRKYVVRGNCRLEVAQ